MGRLPEHHAYTHNIQQVKEACWGFPDVSVKTGVVNVLPAVGGCQGMLLEVVSSITVAVFWSPSDQGCRKEL